ncbi:MAG: hypothetical protein C0608_10560 [Deltaproteobacteria bacterium]|nr:MAG: hypothetical protein C0608_10560 [Deltaproteobacteria bacterium]
MFQGIKALVILAIFLSVSSPINALETTPKRIFLVNSYHKEYFWSARQQEGIRDAMSGMDIVVKEFFLDTKRHTGKDWLERKVSDCLARMEAFEPDIIFTGDDNATREIASRFLGGEIPVIFYGLNAEPEEYSLVETGKREHPGKNVTGVLERHFFVDTLHLMFAICQANDLEVENVYIITDDTMTSRKVLDYLGKMDWNTSAKIIYLPQFGDFEAYKDTLSKINRSGNAAVIYNLQTLKDSKGNIIDYRPVVEWTRDNLNIPTVSFHQVYIEAGLMMGITVSGYSQAYNAGVKGRKILEGASVGEVPIDSPEKGQVVINNKVVKKKGLKIPISVLMGATLVP